MPLPRRLRAVAAALVAGGAVVAPFSLAPPARAANDPLLNQQWNASIVGAQAAWATGTGEGITIAVVDSGVDLGHEDLAPKLVAGKDFADDDASPQDDHGHGTHVSGIAAAATNNGKGVAGIAPNARVMPLRALARDEQGRASGTVSDVTEAVRYAVDNGAKVVNLSLGGNVIVETVTGTNPLRDAIEYAWSKGAIPVVAAGNQALFGSSYGDMNAIVVTATTRDDSFASGYATEVGAAKWGIAAPGGSGGTDPNQNVISTWWSSGKSNSYAATSGTSMAAPHVAGAAAILRGLGLSQQATVDRLLSTAKDLGSPGRDNRFGAGRLDVAKAVDGLGKSSGGATTTTARPATTAPPTTRAGAGGGTTPTTARRGTSTTATTAAPAGEVTPAGETTTTTVPVEPVPVDESTPTTIGDGGENQAITITAPRSSEDDGPPRIPTIVATVALLGTAAGTAAAARFGRPPG